jgi:hypothetical protein
MTNQKIINNITHNNYSDEWYTDKSTVDKCLELLNPNSKSTIMCPFDSGDSIFVKTLLGLDHKVIYGITDFLYSNYEYDYLVTNPPFSIKDKVIEKVFQSNKRSVLVLPLDSLGGVKRHTLYNKYEYPHIYIPTRRISYYDKNWKKREGSNFHSVIMVFNHKEKPEVIWEKFND